MPAKFVTSFMKHHAHVHTRLQPRKSVGGTAEGRGECKQFYVGSSLSGRRSREQAVGPESRKVKSCRTIPRNALTQSYLLHSAVCIPRSSLNILPRANCQPRSKVPSRRRLRAPLITETELFPLLFSSDVLARLPVKGFNRIAGWRASYVVTHCMYSIGVCFCEHFLSSCVSICYESSFRMMGFSMLSWRHRRLVMCIDKK